MPAWCLASHSPWVLARVSFPGRSLVRGLVLVPMVLPPVVGGVALLLAFGPRGMLGSSFEAFGVTVPFSTAATVVAATFVSLPFLVLSVEAAFATVDTDIEDVAATLGGSSWHVFRTVTLPLVRPAVISGATLAWARALGEFGATITFAGSIAGVTQTMPLAVYEVLPTNPDGALTISLLLLVISASRHRRASIDLAHATAVEASIMTEAAPLLSVRARVDGPSSPRIDATFSVASAGVIGVIGPNGAGKTTLLRSIAGLDEVTSSSEIRVHGRAVTSEPPAMRRVAYVPQGAALFPHLDVHDNVAYGLRARGVKKHAARERSSALLGDSGSTTSPTVHHELFRGARRNASRSRER